jgi:hypothetical protein
MLHSFFMRATAFAIWAPSVYLTWWLVDEFTDGQSPVIAGLALIALLVSAVSLITARYAFRAGDKLWGWGSLLTYALGALVMVFLELGYWNSTILGSHQNLVRAEAARDGVELLKEQQREQLRTGAAPASSAEIQAKMDVQLATPIGNQPLGKLTEGCTDQRSAAFRLCGEYLTLKAAHAKAATREALQKATWDNGTSVETRSFKKDIFSGATAVHNATGLGTPTGWAAVFSIVLMALLMVARDLSGLGVFGPRMAPRSVKAQEARTAAEESTAAVVTVEAVPAAAEPNLPSPEVAREVVKPRTPPTNGGTRKTAAKREIDEPMVQTMEEPKPSAVVQFAPRGTDLALPEFASKFFEESAPPAKPKRRTGDRKAVGAVKTWINDSTERSRDPGEAALANEAWHNYLNWCQDEDYRPLPRSKFDRVLTARFGSVSLPSSKGSPGGKGYVGLVLVEDETQKMAAVA